MSLYRQIKKCMYFLKTSLLRYESIRKKKYMYWWCRCAFIHFFYTWFQHVDRATTFHFNLLKISNILWSSSSFSSSESKSFSLSSFSSSASISPDPLPSSAKSSSSLWSSLSSADNFLFLILDVSGPYNHINIKNNNQHIFVYKNNKKRIHEVWYCKPYY